MLKTRSGTIIRTVAVSALQLGERLGLTPYTTKTNGFIASEQSEGRGSVDGKESRHEEFGDSC